jgi:HEAT repeats
MKQEQDSNLKNPMCAPFEPLLMLTAAGEELDAAEQAEVTEHLAHCTACSDALEQEKDLLLLLAANRREPDAAMLASCRASLEDALDRQEERSWLHRLAGAFAPLGWLSARPAWSAALLVMIGFSVGILGPRFFAHPAAPRVATNSAAPDTSSAQLVNSNDASRSSLGALDLHTAEVAGINVFPANANESPQVEVQLRAQQPVTLQGTVDDGDVKRVLLDVLRNNEKFDPDVRLSAVELLRTRTNDPEVRSVLCHAVHTDHNAAVRLKALEALNGAEPQDIIRQTMLDALVDDQNPGVRIEAMNSLRDMAAKGQVQSDAHMLAVLRGLMEKDPSTYIRLQSAAAIRDLGPRQKF